MYGEYFGLTENPFSIAPDPGYLYMSECHREALAHLLYGLKSNGGFVLLTGEVGTGKTTICRCLIDQLPADIDLAFVLNPKVTVRELLETICDELHIARPDNASVKVLVDCLNTRLLEANAKDRKTVLIIDEAQNLSLDVLEQLRLLTNLETARHKLLQIILLGQPELREMINQPQMSQLAQRVTARYHLGPLGRNDVAAYIHHRLHVANCDRMLFPPGTVKQIYRLTGGVPRLINLICDRSLLGAYSLKKAQTDSGIVRQAAREVFDLPTGMLTKSRLAATIAVLVLTAGIGYWLTITNVASTTPSQSLPASVSIVRTGAPREGSPPTMTVDSQKPQTDAQLPQVWPTGFGFSRTQEEAFRDLATLWGLAYLSDQGDPCSFATRSGWLCMESRDSLENLRKFNRPAVLTLYDDQGIPFYVLLISLDGSQARFSAGNLHQELDIAALESRWFGGYRLLWRPPVIPDEMLFPGGAGEKVSWLAESLTKLDLYRLQGDETRLAGTLLGALKRFQFSTGLTPDGVLGPQTIIHLNQALGSPGPQLYDTEVN